MGAHAAKDRQVRSTAKRRERILAKLALEVDCIRKKQIRISTPPFHSASEK